MRKLLILAAALAACLFAPWHATAQSVVKACVEVSSSASGSTILSCQPVSATNPFPVAPGLSSSSTFGITPVVGGSAASSLVLKATPGNLYSVYAECTSACWLMVFNAVTAPSNGATTAGVASGNLVECVDIPANGSRSLSYLPGPPAVFSVGITAAISSTACATLTLSTVGFIHGMIQ
jgi:hypothetical protein